MWLQVLITILLKNMCTKYATLSSFDFQFPYTIHVAYTFAKHLKYYFSIRQWQHYPENLAKCLKLCSYKMHGSKLMKKKIVPYSFNVQMVRKNMLVSKAKQLFF